MVAILRRHGLREIRVHSITTDVERLQSFKRYGRVFGIQGLLVEVAGIQNALSIGSRCRILGCAGREVQLEVAQVGTDQQVLDEVRDRHIETLNFTKVFISDIEDADAAEAVANLNQDRLALEGSFRVLAQISRLSLLDFI